jgi:hypothetical protein
MCGKLQLAARFSTNSFELEIKLGAERAASCNCRTFGCDNYGFFP